MKRKFKIHKREFFYWIAIFFLVWKVYVLYTPSKEDDQIPDQIKNSILNLANN